MDDTAKATEALAKSVASIVNCDESEEAKREALAETFQQFDDYVQKNVGEDIAKAGRDRGSGHHDLAASLVDHLSDALERRREAHGYTKSAKEQPMDTQTELIGIMKDCGGPVALCKGIVDRGRSPCDEHELVAALSKHAGGDRAFAKLYESEIAVRQAINVAKAAPFFAAPEIISGERARGGDVNPSDPAAAMDAYNQLLAKAAEYRRKNPAVSEAQAFSAVFASKENADLAAKAHVRPSATTAYPFPR